MTDFLWNREADRIRAKQELLRQEAEAKRRNGNGGNTESGGFWDDWVVSVANKGQDLINMLPPPLRDGANIIGDFPAELGDTGTAGLDLAIEGARNVNESLDHMGATGEFLKGVGDGGMETGDALWWMATNSGPAAEGLLNSLADPIGTLDSIAATIVENAQSWHGLGKLATELVFTVAGIEGAKRSAQAAKTAATAAANAVDNLPLNKVADLAIDNAGSVPLNKLEDLVQSAFATYSAAPTQPTRFIEGVTVTDIKTGKTLTGTVDVQPTLDRINSGVKYPHHNDGSTFHNNQGRLPAQSGGYYTEYVHPTPATSGPGPQRVVTGKGGEIYYTPDHYNTFIPIN